MLFKPSDGIGTGQNSLLALGTQMLCQGFHQFARDSLTLKGIIHKGVVNICGAIRSIWKCYFSQQFVLFIVKGNLIWIICEIHGSSSCIVIWGRVRPSAM